MAWQHLHLRQIGARLETRDAHRRQGGEIMRVKRLQKTVGQFGEFIVELLPDPRRRIGKALDHAFDVRIVGDIPCHGAAGPRSSGKPRQIAPRACGARRVRRYSVAGSPQPFAASTRTHCVEGSMRDSKLIGGMPSCKRKVASIRMRSARSPSLRPFRTVTCTSCSRVSKRAIRRSTWRANCALARSVERLARECRRRRTTRSHRTIRHIPLAD